MSARARRRKGRLGPIARSPRAAPQPIEPGSFSSRARLLAGGLAVGAAFAAGAIVARSRPAHATGGGVSASLSGLTFAGTLEGASGSQELTFEFAAGEAKCSVAVTVNPDSETKAFTVDLPIDTCPGAIWSGANVTVSVLVGQDRVVDERLIGSVPYAKFAERLGTADCPTEFSRDATDPSVIACTRTVSGQEDAVVRVGAGASAFWIDRYEAALLEPDGNVADATFAWRADGDLGGAGDLPRAVAAKGLAPFPASWFQANLACRASGKRLPTGAEFLAAAHGTPSASCADAEPGAAPGPTGAKAACESRAGAFDLLGNVWEWSEDWSGGAHGLEGGGAWPASAGGGALLGALSVSAHTSLDGSDNGPLASPAAILRGGDAATAVAQLTPLAYLGAFAPTARAPTIGFRCVTPR